MERDTLKLIAFAQVFSNILSELESRDGWLSFWPDFANSVIDQKIEWWELCENSRFRYAEKLKRPATTGKPLIYLARLERLRRAFLPAAPAGPAYGGSKSFHTILSNYTDYNVGSSNAFRTTK